MFAKINIGINKRGRWSFYIKESAHWVNVRLSFFYEKMKVFSARNLSKESSNFASKTLKYCLTYYIRLHINLF